MAAATADSSTEPPGGLSLHFLTSIDMKTLSQSELRALSSLSSHHQNDAALAKAAIDHSTFNESSGSRRQTYSRLSPHQHHHRHHRLAAPLPKTPSDPAPQNPNPSLTSDLDRLDSRSILVFLKQMLSSHPDFQFPDPIEFNNYADVYNYEPEPVSVSHDLGERKRKKRGRKPRAVGAAWEGNMGLLVNRDGVVVDLEALAGKDDPYAEELARRTAAMDGEEALLGFFAGLGGEWCSRRKRRKVVDAEEFGDHLPLGWKLLLGLRRKEGHAWVYCRRYVSPDGQHFVSCKEVSAYLQSFIGSYHVRQGKDHAGDRTQQVYIVASVNLADTMKKEENQRLSNQNENNITLLDIHNLVEVQIHDLFECDKCDISFDEKDAYLQHLLSFHQRTTKRYRGSSVGDGVIIKDGKYECQFCHKVFHERRRYSGHVGIHVRNYVRGIEDAPGIRMALEKRKESQMTDESPARISKMDALIEIAQNSIGDASSAGIIDELYGGSTSDEQIWRSKPELHQSVSDIEINYESVIFGPDMENQASDSSTDTEIDQENCDDMDIDGKMHKMDDSCNVVEVKVDSSCEYRENVQAFGSNAIEHEKAKDNALALLSDQKTYILEKVDKGMNVEVQVGFDISSGVPHNQVVCTSPQKNSPENGLECDNLEASASSLQPPPVFSVSNAFVDKGGNMLGTNDHVPPRITGFEELGLEEIDQLKFGSGNAQEKMFPTDVQKGLGNSSEMEGAYGTSVQFASEEGVVDTVDSQQHTTVCVWCGAEFIHEIVDTELQSDSVGYMCLTCKAKISGQLNVLDGSCS